MKKIYTFLMMAIVATLFTSCDNRYWNDMEDREEAYTLEGTWTGYVDVYFNDRFGMRGDSYRTTMYFERTNSYGGWGYEVDYNMYNRYEDYYYCEFNWDVVNGKIRFACRNGCGHGQMRFHFAVIPGNHAFIQSHPVQLPVQKDARTGAGTAVEHGNVPPGQIPPAADLLGIAGRHVKALCPIRDVDQHSRHARQQLFYKGRVEALFLRVIEMARRGVDPPLIKSEKTLETVEIDALGRDVLLIKEARKNVQHHILSRDDERVVLRLLRVQKRALELCADDRLHALFVAGARDIGVHVVLRKAHLPAYFVGVDFSPADQFIDRGLAHMKDLSDLLGGQTFVLRHSMITPCSVCSCVCCYYNYNNYT